MIRILGLMLASVMLAAPASHAGETSDVLAPGAYFFCRSDRPVGTTFYFTTTQPAAGVTSRARLQSAFMEFLRTKYHYPHDAAVSCPAAAAGNMQADTESSRLQTIDNLHAANYEVVVTDWKYAD